MDLFLSFNGRINRAKWWLGLLVLFVAQMVIWFILGSVLGMSTMGGDPADAEAMMQNMTAMMIPTIIIVIILIYPALALYAKRWHDRNKSGWWSLILLVPVVGSIWVLIELGILRGTDGDNRYGPDPLA